jgi:outer membrane biosynthesis protein TonB
VTSERQLTYHRSLTQLTTTNSEEPQPAKMAPKTRLRSKPALHMDYVDMSDPDPALVGSRHNPVQLEDTPEPPTPVRKTARKPARTPVTPRKSVTRVKSGAVVKPKKEPKVVRRSPKPKRKVRPAKQECSICVTTKSTASSFKVPEDACEHFQSICGLCIQRMLKTKVAERQLAEPGLPCPFPDCKHALDYTALKGAVTKAAFEE